jgi:hypothetical protein
MPKHKKNTRSRQKELYRVRNWSEYDRALVKRGSLTIWMSEEAITKWKPEGPKQRGAQKAYSELAIETALTLKEVFHLTNRGTEGLIGSIFQLMGVDLSVPDHTTLSRRGKGLVVHLSKRKKTIRHLVVDSTGLKLYGEGEWKMRKHGKSKRRVWRKIHLSVDSESGEIQAGAMSDAGVSDAEALTAMLKEIDQLIENFSGVLFIAIFRSTVRIVVFIFHLARMLASGSTATAIHLLIHEMRTCVTSASMAVLPGNGIPTTINAHWLKQPCSA